MKNCPRCSTPLEDNVKFCTTCGLSFEQPANESEPAADNTSKQKTPQYGQPFFGQQQYVPPIEKDPFDHTDEFDPRDISENKVIAMLIYLMGIAGVLIALLSQSHSAYVAFHLRQALKFMVCNALLTIAAAVLSWTVIVPVACGIAIIVLLVVKIICFVDICNGKAKEPAIIKNLNFLK